MNECKRDKIYTHWNVQKCLDITVHLASTNCVQKCTEFFGIKRKFTLSKEMSSKHFSFYIVLKQYKGLYVFFHNHRNAANTKLDIMHSPWYRDTVVVLSLSCWRKNTEQRKAGWVSHFGEDTVQIKKIKQSTLIHKHSGMKWSEKKESINMLPNMLSCKYVIMASGA